MEFVQNGYRERKIGIPCTELSAKYRGVRYFGISLHHYSVLSKCQVLIVILIHACKTEWFNHFGNVLVCIGKTQIAKRVYVL